jgi:hypothetical protein
LIKILFELTKASLSFDVFLAGRADVTCDIGGLRLCVPEAPSQGS